jgi:hypothetical protein
MKKNLIAMVGILLFVFIFVKPGHSQEVKTSPIEVKSYEGIPYVSGGIGLDEREELEASGKDYNLKLTFAVREGNYLGDVKVSIVSSSGKKILDAVSEGPWFFTRLPPGRYSVRAEVKDKTLQRAFEVKAKGQTRLNFLWQR